MPNKKRKPKKSGKGHSALSDPLRILRVFDRLEVGPVILEPRKLTMPYKIFYSGRKNETELIYAYDEDVFDKDNSAIRNLAGVIGAQVALNYGLFCSQIIFHGIFDKADRRFINDMAENTSREIYIKKFLEPNPFLVGKAANLPAIKKRKYLAAELLFPDSKLKPARMPRHYLTAETNRYCVLSSGGKDSLLSYGLLNDIGVETHPIFINESGRHWFTALNAYRHFRDNIPTTARVWVNCDRVFNWMLRRMSFIRKDYANIRTDEYAIRLWTVAVFLFGALPLMHKRGLNRLIIGDEYDTTDKKSFQGISHYNGAYDQSYFFDKAISKYFQRKDWEFTQFSILRPLSELLIEKILAERYPNLLKLQVSCHATHERDKHIYPCGKCEKCRRIVGMLTAIGVSPHNCGYDNKQIQKCLQALPRGKLHQEAPGYEHLAYLLSQKNAVEFPKERRRFIKAHPDIMKLRFHPDKSPLNSIPEDLREPLYKIFMKYADGAIRWERRRWIGLDPFTDPLLRLPYPFQRHYEY